MGYVTLRCSVNGKSGIYNFFVADLTSPAVLGIRTCQELGLVKKGEQVFALDSPKSSITREELLTTYNDVFKGLGKLDDPYDIQLKPDAKPVIHPPR